MSVDRIGLPAVALAGHPEAALDKIQDSPVFRPFPPNRESDHGPQELTPHNQACHDHDDFRDAEMKRGENKIKEGVLTNNNEKIAEGVRIMTAALRR
ncbi:MAG: hypothetical protein FWD68_20710 [Alphaproteobacteria bacterium]|nr:hypothetical protein [Alphaproteobacteria bacterium]